MGSATEGERTVTVSLFDNCRDTAPKAWTGTRDEFVDLLAPHGDEKDGRAVCGASFREGGRRCAEDVEAVHVLLLDVDDADGTLNELTRPLADYEAVLWTTWSHTDPQRPKYRHALPLSRAVTPEEYRVLWRAVDRLLGGIADSATKDPCRLMYTPRETGISGKPASVFPHVPPDRVSRGWLDPDALPDGSGGTVSVGDLLAEERARKADRETATARREYDGDDWVPSALEALDPADLDYADWLAVGMALESDGRECSTWDRWSARDAERYEPGVCDEKWASFCRGNVTLGTLWHLATKRGWKPPSPPKIQAFFARGDHVELARTIIENDTRRGVRPVSDELGRYHVWDAEVGLWIARDDHEIRRRVYAFAGVSVDAGDTTRPLKIRGTDAPSVVSIARDETLQAGFFRDDVVAFENRFVAHVKGDQITIEATQAAHGARVALPISYDETWSDDRLEGTLLAHYLGTTFDDEDDRIRAVEILGAGLMGIGTRLKKAWLLLDSEEVDGGGGTGKSQFLEMLGGLVPTARICSIPPHQLSDDYHGADLYGRTLNLVYETPDVEILREEGIKAIVHGERVRRRRIRQDPIEFEPQALHVFAANRAPDAPGATGAFWDRWEVLEFGKRFRNTDAAIPELAKRVLADERQHLVHLAIRGASRLLARGRYTASETSTEAIARWKRGADPVAAYFDEWTVPIDDSTAASNWTTGTELYDDYRQWCEARGHRPCSHTKFGRRIPTHVPRVRSNGSRYGVRTLSQTERGWRATGGL